MKLTEITYSGTRVPYSVVTFTAINNDNGQEVSAILHSMWGGSGLHYGANVKLPGKGSYTIIIDVGIPTFTRGDSHVDLLMTAAQVSFSYEFTEDIEDHDEEEETPAGEFFVEGLLPLVVPVLLITLITWVIFSRFGKREGGI